MAPVATKNGSKASEETIEIVRPRITRLRIAIRGTSPLICHRWTEKAKKEMLDKHMNKPQKAKEAKDPERDFEGSLYRLEDGSGYGFPAVAFKSAAVRAGKQVGLVMVDLRTWFHVRGELVRIDGEPRPREDMVRLNGTKPDIRYRGEFPEWSTTVEVEVNESKLSVDQLVSLFDGAGFGVGVGEWRPERDGQYGRFEVTGVERIS